MKLNPSIKNMSNEYIFFTDQTALTFRICLVYAGERLTKERDRLKKMAIRTNKWPVNKRGLIRRHCK